MCNCSTFLRALLYAQRAVKRPSMFFAFSDYDNGSAFGRPFSKLMQGVIHKFPSSNVSRLRSQRIPDADFRSSHHMVMFNTAIKSRAFGKLTESHLTGHHFSVRDRILGTSALHCFKAE